MRHTNYPSAMGYARKTALYALHAVVVGVVCCLLFGCKSIEYVDRVRTEYVHDTLKVKVIERDSINVRDSVSRVERGDTVWIDRWHREYVDRLVHDTVDRIHFEAVHDTVPIRVEVPAELTLKEKAYLKVGEWTWWIWIVLLLIGVLWIVKKVYLRR